MWEELSQVTYKDAVLYTVYAVALISSFVALSMNTIVMLRVLMVVSSVCYVIYYYFFPVTTLWLDVGSEAGFALVNLFMISVLLRKKSKLTFTEEEKLLHQAYFISLPPFDFIKLMSIASWKTLDIDFKLAEQGKTLSHLTFIYDGKADIIKHDKKVAEVNTGCFVGEISFKLKQPASATVSSQKNTRIVQWPQDKLHELTDKYPGMKNCVDGLISNDLAMKLAPTINTPA